MRFVPLNSLFQGNSKKERERERAEKPCESLASPSDTLKPARGKRVSRPRDERALHRADETRSFFRGSDLQTDGSSSSPTSEETKRSRRSAGETAKNGAAPALP